MSAWERWRAYPVQVLIALDQLANALIPPVTALSFADETLSARAFRADRDGRIFGRALRPLIDTLFFWQREHCRMAYRAEVQRRGLPPEYRS